MADRIKNYQQEADQITTLKAIRTDFGVTPSSYTPDATVVTKDRVVTFAQAEEELVVLSDIEKGVKQQVTEVDIAQKDVANIKALLQGHLYDYQTDTNSAYTKSVPSGAMPYAGLEKVGGKTVVWNQLCGDLASASYYSKVADGHYLINGSPSSGTSYRSFLDANSNEIKSVIGHKYYAYLKATEVGVVLYNNSVLINATNVDTHYSVITTASTESAFQIRSGNSAGTLVYDNADVYVRIVDLTLMFGAGNEPSTVAEFEAMFPADYYAYNAGTLLSAGVTEVVSKDSNNATLQTIPIPTAIRNLEGYGWSAGTAYNYVDFERKKFVKCVEKIVIDGNAISFTGGGVAGSNGNYRFTTNTMDIGIVNGGGNITNVISLPISYDYDAVITNVTTTTRNGIVYTQSRFFIEFADPAIATTTSGVNTWLQSNPITMYYELATPVETDISEYLTDDNLIKVESGGTLTFENQHGDDYRIPVPSEETYMIDLQEAINNG